MVAILSDVVSSTELVVKIRSGVVFRTCSGVLVPSFVDFDISFLVVIIIDDISGYFKVTMPDLFIYSFAYVT